MRARSAAHARELCDWTDAIFTSSEIEETDEERRLRHAGCLLSDIGWRRTPNIAANKVSIWSPTPPLPASTILAALTWGLPFIFGIKGSTPIRHRRR